MMRTSGILLTLLCVCGAVAHGESVYVEAEALAKCGGWCVMTDSVRTLGSSYLMAHGYGKPVADAEGIFTVANGGEYRVWARTRNWNAVWTRGAAGRWRVLVDGKAIGGVLGVGSADWHWAEAGVVTLPKGTHTLALRDLTGFNGRCDAICLTSGSENPAKARPKIAVRDDQGQYDLIVVGGGVSGCCAALAAARCGARTLLLQDRDVLGGCNSSEVRVGLGGRIGVAPYPELGRIVGEIQPMFGTGSPLPGEYYEDARKRIAFEVHRRWYDVCGVAPTLRFGQYVCAIETNAHAIVAVIARDVRSGALTRYRAPLFCDATGDAVLARMAGCETMYGREARSRWNEISAPIKADRQVMGLSVQWLSRDETADSPFPDISAWALAFDAETANYRTCGSWEQEFGQLRDMADDAERIRDYGLLSIFSNWHYVKNRSSLRAEFSRRCFDWISPIGGKRESYRVVGDLVLNQNDLENHVPHDDATATITWSTDLHFPDPRLAGKFPEPVRSAAYHRGFGGEYPVPYRCLYARDCDNLFLAGRHISCSHVAFGAVRVMRTLGMLGEVVGMAASICAKRGERPRDIYAKRLAELKDMMKKGVPRLPQFHGYHEGWEEKYDFNYRGWLHVYPRVTTNLSAGQKGDLAALGYLHRNEHPELQDAHRRLILADESRGRLHYYDSADPNASYSVPVKKPVWDLKPLGDNRYRTVCHGGFQVTDMTARKVVDEFKCPIFGEWMATACCDLPDGGFVFAVNPVGPDAGKAIHFCTFGPDRKMRRVIRMRGWINARSMVPGRDGEWLIAHEHGFARVRLPAEGEKVEVVRDYPQPSGRNLFAVIPDRAGTGYWAGTGYGADLVRFAADGRMLSVWKADQGGKQNFFYGQPEERADGRVYVANWTGHGGDDSVRGWQVVEFDSNGKVVWHLDSPDRFGSISGLIVLEETPKKKERQ